MSDFTPGNWTVATNGFTVFANDYLSPRIADTLNNNLLGALLDEQHEQLIEQFKANAHLISAAPDLLEALYFLRYEGCWCWLALDSSGHTTRCKTAENAIKKAKGEA